MDDRSHPDRAELISSFYSTYDEENRLLAHSLMTGFITENPLFDD